MNNLQQVREIQKIELEIFEEFKRICKKYNLTYFAIGGTCIGAIRHKGFIPWDDDIDIAMPYKDYRKFREFAPEEIGEPFEIYDATERRYSNFGFIKIHNSHTTFIEESCLPYPDRYIGVAIDIMPIYGLPKNPLKKKYCIHLCNYGIKKNRVVRFPFSEEKKLQGKILWLLTFFRRRTEGYNYYLKKIELTLGNYDFCNSNEVIFGWRCLPLIKRKSYHYKLVFPVRIFEKVLEVPFENTTINIPELYDEYLKMDFGDYMKLPPQEMQVPLHKVAILDLEKSYKEYTRGGIK